MSLFSLYSIFSFPCILHHKDMKLDISMLNSIHLLHTETLNLLFQATPMCCVDYHIKIFGALLYLLMLTNNVTLTTSRRDTTRPLSIQFRPFTNSVHDTECDKRCNVCMLIHNMQLLVVSTRSPRVPTSG